MRQETYKSLEQRAARGYLDTFPPFIPHEHAPVSIEAQSIFYGYMRKLYLLAQDEPQLFVPKLHADTLPPALYSAGTDSEREAQKHMKQFRKAVDGVVMKMYLMGAQGEVKLDRRQSRILSRLGAADAAALPAAWVWMAKKEHLERFQTPSRFAHCCFREDYVYAADIYERAFHSAAFIRLKDWMVNQGYKPFQIYDATASDCRFSLTYANPAWCDEPPRGGFEYKIRHTGIAMRYESCCRDPWILGLCIPGGMMPFLDQFDRMPACVQDFVISRVKRCDGCRYCIQTDKTGKRPLARVAVRYAGEEIGLCPYYPGYRFWWNRIDDALADRLIEFLRFMDVYAPHKKNPR